GLQQLGARAAVPEAARHARRHREPRRLLLERRVVVHHRSDRRDRRRLGDALAMGALDGEVAVVTGARQGIGAAIARGLAGAGARVAVTHHDRSVAEALAGELGSPNAGFALDLRSTASVDAAAADIAERLGETTVLVNSAAVNKI